MWPWRQRLGWCIYKPSIAGNTTRGRHGRDSPWRPQRTALPKPWFCTFSLQNCERINLLFYTHWLCHFVAVALGNSFRYEAQASSLPAVAAHFGPLPRQSTACLGSHRLLSLFQWILVPLSFLAFRNLLLFLRLQLCINLKKFFLQLYWSIIYKP